MNKKLTGELTGELAQIANHESSKEQNWEEYFTNQIVSIKQLRKDIDIQIQNLKNMSISRERALSITKLQEAVMWLGMDLKRINDENPSLNMPTPYPSSKDPSTGSKIEPTADNLKL